MKIFCWLRLSAIIITAISFGMVISAFFNEEMTVNRLVWTIIGALADFGLCAVNTWLFVRDIKRLEKNKTDNNS